MTSYAWQKSSYCAQGESCLHIAATAHKTSHGHKGDACAPISTGPGTPLPLTAIHLTESADPARAVLTATPSAFAALLLTLGRPSPHR